MVTLAGGSRSPRVGRALAVGGNTRFKTWEKGFDHRVTPLYILESTSGTVIYSLRPGPIFDLGKSRVLAP